jgi:hypothetical protein
MTRNSHRCFVMVSIFLSLLLMGLSLWIGMTILVNLLQKKQVVIPMVDGLIEVPSDHSLKHFYSFTSEKELIYRIPWLGEDKKNITNKDGLVDRFNYETAKPARSFRIIALGDSFTQGIMVETAESYPERLEELLQYEHFPWTRQVEVLNFGVGGYDIEYSVNKLRVQGIKYSPDLLIWLVKFDDFFLINEKMIQARGSFQEELESAGIRLENGKLANFYGVIDRVGELYARSFNTKSLLQYQINNLANVRTFYQKKILLLYFDDEHPLIIDILNSLKEKDENIALLAIPSDVPRFPDGHPNANGYEQIAKVLHPRISAIIRQQDDMMK